MKKLIILIGKCFASLVVVSLSITMLSCKTNSVNSASQVELEELHNVVESRNFTIISDVAYPRATNAMMNLQNSGLFGNGNTANRISLIGNSNYLTVKNDSVQSDLPYYGERQMGAGYDRDEVGIKLDSEIREYEAVYNEKKQFYTIQFKSKSKRENFDTVITIFPNLSCRMTITGTKRFSIGYAGQLKPVEDIN